MTSADEKEIEKLAREFEQSLCEDDQMKRRAIRAFANVIKWWTDEMRRARDADDPVLHFLDASSMLAFQVGATLRSTLIGQPEEFKRRVLTYIISIMERGLNEDLLPTRREINKFEEFANASVH